MRLQGCFGLLWGIGCMVRQFTVSGDWLIFAGAVCKGGNALDALLLGLSTVAETAAAELGRKAGGQSGLCCGKGRCKPLSLASLALQSPANWRPL